MRRLHIAQIGPLNVPIPPEKYGGTERVVDALCRGLTERGHDVTLFAAGDSRVPGRLVPVIPKSLWTFAHKDASPYYAYEMTVIAREAKRRRFDIIHDHLGPMALSLYGAVTAPIVHTLHVPMNDDRAWAYRKLGARLVSISNDQRKPAPDLRYAGTIYHGIDTKRYAFRPNAKDYLLFIGELSKRKGILEAIEVARRAKAKLLIAGRVPTQKQRDDHEFFHAMVKPLLKRRGLVRYVGEVGEKEAVQLYGGARATLFPIQWNEPFGLVMVESMACGTPVIAFRQGSVPEVIKHGVTGFIVKRTEDMVHAIGNIDRLDRRACRDWVERRFTLGRMVEEYEALFLRLVKNRGR